MDIIRGSALIKHYFGSSIAGMDDEAWSQEVAEAMWLAKFNARLIAIETRKILFPAKGKSNK